MVFPMVPTARPGLLHEEYAWHARTDAEIHQSNADDARKRVVERLRALARLCEADATRLESGQQPIHRPWDSDLLTQIHRTLTEMAEETAAAHYSAKYAELLDAPQPTLTERRAALEVQVSDARIEFQSARKNSNDRQRLNNVLKARERELANFDEKHPEAKGQ